LPPETQNATSQPSLEMKHLKLVLRIGLPLFLFLVLFQLPTRKAANLSQPPKAREPARPVKEETPSGTIEGDEEMKARETREVTPQAGGKWSRLSVALEQGFPVKLKRAEGGTETFWMRPRKAVGSNFRITVGTDRAGAMPDIPRIYEGYRFYTDNPDEKPMGDEATPVPAFRTFATFAIVGNSFAAVIHETGGIAREITTNPATGRLEQVSRLMPIKPAACILDPRKRIASISMDMDDLTRKDSPPEMVSVEPVKSFGGEDPSTGQFSRYIDPITGGHQYGDSLKETLMLVVMDKHATGSTDTANLTSKASIQLCRMANISCLYENQIGTRILVQELILTPNTNQYSDIPQNILQFRGWGEHHRPRGSFPRALATKVGAGLYGGTIGMAFVGGVNSTFGYSVVLPGYDHTVLAHEIGHNFGAGHSNGGVMNAFWTPGARNFFHQVNGGETSAKQMYNHARHRLRGPAPLRHPEEIPFAENDFVKTDKNETVTLEPMQNDLDSVENGQKNRLSLAELGPVFPIGSGQALLEGGTVTFTPARDFTGIAWFSYTLQGDVGNEGRGWLHKGNIAVQVQDPPPEFQLTLKPGDSHIHYPTGGGAVDIIRQPEQARIDRTADDNRAIIVRVLADASGSDSFVYRKGGREYTVDLNYGPSGPVTRPDVLTLPDGQDQLRFNPTTNDEMAGTRSPHMVRPVIGLGNNGAGLYPNGFQLIHAQLLTPGKGTLTLETSPVFVDGRKVDVNNGFLIFKAAGDAGGQARIEYTVADAAGNEARENVTIILSDDGNTPSSFILTHDQVPENQPAGTEVGKFIPNENKDEATPAFKIVGGRHSEDFTLDENRLLTTRPLDFEEGFQRELSIRMTNKADGQEDHGFTINVINANDAPTGLRLEPASIAEDATMGTEIGLLSAGDPDAGDRHALVIIGGADEDSFRIEGDRLLTNALLDFEARPVLEVIIRVTDAAGASLESTLQVNVTDVDEPDTRIVLDNDNVPENQPTDTLVGHLSLSGRVPGDTPNYGFRHLGLVSVQAGSTSDIDDISIIDLDTGKVHYENNFDSGSLDDMVLEYSRDAGHPMVNDPSMTRIVNNRLRLQTTGFRRNGSGGYNSCARMILSRPLPENFELNVKVNKLQWNGHFFIEVYPESKPGNWAFQSNINGSQVNYANVRFGEETRNLLTPPGHGSSGPFQGRDVAYRMIKHGSTLEFYIQGQQRVLTHELVPGNPEGREQGDPVFTLTPGEGDGDNALFRIVGDELRLAGPLNFEERELYSIRVRATLPDGFSVGKTFTIRVTDEGEELRVYGQPEDTTANEDGIASLKVRAEGPANLAFTWHRDSQPVRDGNGISGASSPTLLLDPASVLHEGSYRCLMETGTESIWSDPAEIKVIRKPFATRIPEDRVLDAGKTATFRAQIRGSKPMTYRWSRDGRDIAGAATSRLRLRGIRASDAGRYTLTVTNAAGSILLKTNLAVTGSLDYGEIPPLGNSHAANEDSDGDGVANLLEHALGSNPAVNQSRFAPIIETVEDGSGEKYISFSYTENKNAADVRKVVERSADLASWEPLDLATSSISRLDRGHFTEVTVYIPANEGAGFFRVRVEQ
jgi:hypothetical protein